MSTVHPPEESEPEACNVGTATGTPTSEDTITLHDATSDVTYHFDGYESVFRQPKNACIFEFTMDGTTNRPDFTMQFGDPPTTREWKVWSGGTSAYGIADGTVAISWGDHAGIEGTGTVKTELAGSRLHVVATGVRLRSTTYGDDGDTLDVDLTVDLP